MSLPRIYVIGDSISLQYGPFLARAVEGVCEYSRKTGEAEALLNLDEPRGANGGDSAMVLEFLEALARGAEPPHHDVLLVNCGLHDLKADHHTGELQVPIEAYRENLPAIVGVGRRLARSFVWIRTTPVDDTLHARRGCNFSRVQEDVARYNRVADEIMAAQGVPSIDLAAFTSRLAADGPIFQDGVHFTPDTQARQGAYIAGWLSGWFADQAVRRAPQP